MESFFSVVIPSLNEANTIGQILDDLVKQSYKQFEVIIVDGKSEDNTLQVVKKYNKKLDITIVKASRRNLCYQKNLGATHAKGKYLVFFDADISVHKNYLKEIYSVIKEYNSSFLTTYQLPDIDNSFDILLVEIANITLEMLSVIHKQMAPGYNLVVLRDLFIDLQGFDEEAVFSEDHELSIRIWKEKREKLKIIRKHLLRWSFRRLRKDGRLSVIYKYSLATFYMLFRGKITDNSFRYPMGGDYFISMNSQGKRKYLEKFKEEIKKLIDFDSI